jgi:hypothetical protein
MAMRPGKNRHHKVTKQRIGALEKKMSKRFDLNKSDVPAVFEEVRKVLGPKTATNLVDASQQKAFVSWEDVKARAKNVGLVRIEKLKTHGFFIGDASAGDASVPEPEPEAENNKKPKNKRNSMRLSVSQKAQETWDFRKDLDAYTKQTKARLVEENTKLQVDHVTEIQWHDVAWHEGVHQNLLFSPAHAVRNLSKAQTLANSVFNLNNTTVLVNQQKKGPCGVLLRCYKEDRCREDQIAAALKTSQAHKALQKQETWKHIKAAVVAAYDDLSEACQHPPFDCTPIQQEVVLAYQEQFHGMLDKMRVFSL